MSNDDLLTPEEIEALMQAARGASTPSGETAAAAELASVPQDTTASPGKPAASLQTSHTTSTTAASWPGPSPDQLLREAEEQLLAALADQADANKSRRAQPQTAQPFQFPQLHATPSHRTGSALPLGALHDVELDLRVELGRTELLIEEVLQIREGTVVPLDKLAGDPVDIYVNGQLVARGEVLVLNDNFCVRVAEIVQPRTPHVGHR
ncbi:MAG: hypothetical protein KatS3mg114_0572 [Planctomycetaceae bacterium]|nr:MAG: hypothetical protein KatS3mg114_0572 [Planctomycetaceae bacterium]